MPGHGGRCDGSDWSRWGPNRCGDAQTDRLASGRPHRGYCHRSVHAGAVCGIAAGCSHLRRRAARREHGRFRGRLHGRPASPVCVGEGGEHAVVRRQRRGARASHAQSADASTGAQRTQRHLRGSRSHGRGAECLGGHDQSRRTGHRDSRRSRRQARQRHGADAARHGASGHDEHSGTERRHAAAGDGHAQRHLLAADGDVDQAGAGRSRAHRRQSEVAAADAGHHRLDAHGCLSRRDLAGRQRPDDRLR